ncbi:hypothetical protein RvY_19327 [Ramazzottius varieornatus]|uniref:Uncharacterized protein n=1 Tax=Ramazzottius varieornatus TaxID=947166 RepID=A0A1D1W919_RAMVA|nr:hypothetical protein RvY_19325 [Ramazzottius varieornatus]GAV09854.1 hypothetical protein RvY_19327 [Ramazzottius varieornatus]
MAQARIWTDRAPSLWAPRNNDNEVNLLQDDAEGPNREPNATPSLRWKETTLVPPGRGRRVFLGRV